MKEEDMTCKENTCAYDKVVSGQAPCSGVGMEVYTSEKREDVTPRKLIRSLISPPGVSLTPLRDVTNHSQTYKVNTMSLVKAVNVKNVEVARRTKKGVADVFSKENTHPNIKSVSVLKTPSKKINIRTVLTPAPASLASPDCMRCIGCKCKTCSEEFDKIVGTPISTPSPSVIHFKKTTARTSPHATTAKDENKLVVGDNFVKLRKGSSLSPSPNVKPPLYKSPVYTVPSKDKLRRAQVSPQTEIRPREKVSTERLVVNHSNNATMSMDADRTVETTIVSDIDVWKSYPVIVTAVVIVLLAALLAIAFNDASTTHNERDGSGYHQQEHMLVEIMKYLGLVSQPDVFIVY